MKKLIIISLILSSCVSKTLKVSYKPICTNEPEYLKCVEDEFIYRQLKGEIIYKDEFNKVFNDCCRQIKGR